MWKIPEGEDDFVLVKSTDKIEWIFHTGILIWNPLCEKYRL